MFIYAKRKAISLLLQTEVLHQTFTRENLHSYVFAFKKVFLIKIKMCLIGKRNIFIYLFCKNNWLFYYCLLKRKEHLLYAL